MIINNSIYWLISSYNQIGGDEDHSQDTQGGDHLPRHPPRRHGSIPLTQVQQLKEAIQAQKGLEPDSQKIVFKGKATTNTDVLSTLGVKENDFLVVMSLIKKPDQKK